MPLTGSPRHLGLGLVCFTPFLLAACSVNDSLEARRAQKQLIGLSEVDLESCIGAPDQHASFGTTDVLTYYFSSASSTSYSIPVVGGVGLSNGGNCRATFQVRDGHVTQLLYSGEKNASFAPDAYCAPILHTCLAHLADMASAPPAPATPAASTGSPSQTSPPPNVASPAQSTPPGAGNPAAAP